MRRVSGKKDQRGKCNGRREEYISFELAPTVDE